MNDFFTPANMLMLLSLSVMEIVLGVDNILFLSIVTAHIRGKERARVRRIGLGLALGMRVALLLAIRWVMGLTEPFAHVGGRGFSGRDLILIGGGVFLILKPGKELWEKIEGHENEHTADLPAEKAPPNRKDLWGIFAQIVVLDIVFSLDSVITAVGMAQDIRVMITAMLIAVGCMMFFASPFGDFVTRYPTMTILALAFLVMIGLMLVAEAFGAHPNKGYLYAAMAFSSGIELLNLRRRGNARRRKVDFDA